MRPRRCRSPPNIVLLAQNEEGYGNLMRLVEPGLSRRAARASSRASRLPALSAHSEGLIALTGGPAGPLDPRAAQRRDARIWPRRGSTSSKSAFGHQLYVEIQRHGLRRASG